MADLALAVIAEIGIGIFKELDRGESGVLFRQSLNLGTSLLGFLAFSAVVIFLGLFDKGGDATLAQRLPNVIVESADLPPQKTVERRNQVEIVEPQACLDYFHCSVSEGDTSNTLTMPSKGVSLAIPDRA